MADSLQNPEQNDARFVGLETEVRALRQELRRARVSLWRLAVGIVMVVGLRDCLGQQEFWRIAVLLSMFASPIVAIVLLLRWLFSLDDKDAQPSHAERMDPSKLVSSTSTSQGS